MINSVRQCQTDVKQCQTVAENNILFTLIHLYYSVNDKQMSDNVKQCQTMSNSCRK